MSATRFFDKSLLTVETPDGKFSLFSLAVPLFLSSISAQLLAMVQTMLAARYEGGLLVIPIALSTTLYSLFYNIANIATLGMSIILSVLLGKGQRDDCRRVVGTALVTQLMLTTLVCLLGEAFAPQLLRLVGLGRDEYAKYADYAMVYFRMQTVALIPALLAELFNATLRCYGNTRVGIVGTIVSSSFNVVTTALIVYVFKLPIERGVYAFATVAICAPVLNAFVMLCFALRKRLLSKLGLSMRFMHKLFAIGVPAALTLIFYSISSTVTTSICTMLSEPQYLAKNYVAQLVYFVYAFGAAIGQANSLIVGRVIGMGEIDRADRIHRQDLRIVLFCNTSLSLLFVALARPLVGVLYDAGTNVLAYVTGLAAIDLAVEFGRGMNHVGANGLNATGDVRFTTIIAIVSCWAFGVGLAYVFGILCHMGVYGIWTAFAVDELFRGTTYYVRWRKRGWLKRAAGI